MKAATVTCRARLESCGPMAWQNMKAVAADARKTAVFAMVFMGLGVVLCSGFGFGCWRLGCCADLLRDLLHDGLGGGDCVRHRV